MIKYTITVEKEDDLSPSFENEIRELVSNYLASKNLNGRCSIQDKTFLSFTCRQETGMLRKIRQEHIIYIEKCDHKVILHTLMGDYDFYSSLKKMELQLNPDFFVRVHQGYIVNIREIKMLYTHELSLMSCDAMIPVSRRHRAYLGKKILFS